MGRREGLSQALGRRQGEEKKALTQRVGFHIYAAMRLFQALAVGVALAALGRVSAASAEIYMYRDSRGSIHFSNAPADPGYRPYEPQFKPGAGRMLRLTSPDPARRKAFDALIRSAARRYRVDSALVKAVIHAESDFVPYARSPKGALGLMQLMPETARMHNVWRVFEPKDNIEGGVEHLRWLLDQYKGNVRLALAAYNAGENAVARYNGVPPFPETIEYLDRVLRYRDQYAHEH
jgi:soluble lytic murein transglycosylase-like protein